MKKKIVYGQKGYCSNCGRELDPSMGDFKCDCDKPKLILTVNQIFDKYVGTSCPVDYISEEDKQFLDLEAVKKQGYWKEGDKTYVIEVREYPHDENCTGTMCYCGNRAKRER